MGRPAIPSQYELVYRAVSDEIACDDRPAPPAPTPADCTTLLLSGAGRVSANGIYHLMPGKTSGGCPVFQNERYHQIRRVAAGNAWEVASGGSDGAILYMTMGNATTMPPMNGWRCEMATTGERVVPAPASVVCQTK